MTHIVTCGIKLPQKLLDSRIYHSHGELRIISFPECGAVLKPKVHGEWIPIKESPAMVMPGHHKLTGGCFWGENFYFTTYGQVMEFDIQRRSYRSIWTSPLFNDLHHVIIQNERLYVVNTGLERIDHRNLSDGKYSSIELLNYIGLRSPFDENVDYRHVWSTKPHMVHANHIFWFDGEPWVTRFIQKDVLALKSLRRLDLSPWGNPHDGFLVGNEAYFTTTNAHIVRYSFAKNEYTSWDVNKMYGREFLGWCRGISIKDNIGFIAFTQFRTSKTKEMGKWIFQRKGHFRLPSFILKVDLENSKVLGKFEFEEKDITLFGIYEVQ